MRQKITIMAGLTAMGLLLSTAGVQAQHGHLNAGAKGTNQGDQLYWANGDIFAYNSGYVKEMTYAGTGTYAGNYEGGITPTALPATAANTGPAFGAAAVGSFLVTEVISMDGPPGGSWSFWEGGSKAPTFTLRSGTTDGTNRFDLSNKAIGAGAPGADPYGHLHGRRFTVNTWGVYKVGFKILDISTNGTGGGPIHIPSDPFFINFGTQLKLTQLRKNNDGASMSVSGDPSASFFVETSPTLGGTDPWTAVAGPLTYVSPGYYTVTDTNATGTIGFYRLRLAP